jgi:hypothetical protein
MGRRRGPGVAARVCVILSGDQIGGAARSYCHTKQEERRVGGGGVIFSLLLFVTDVTTNSTLTGS